MKIIVRCSCGASIEAEDGPGEDRASCAVMQWREQHGVCLSRSSNCDAAGEE